MPGNGDGTGDFPNLEKGDDGPNETADHIAPKSNTTTHPHNNHGQSKLDTDSKSSDDRIEYVDVESQPPSHPKVQDTIPYHRLILDQSVITTSMLHYHYPGAGTPASPYRVEFIPSDPRNPQNFPEWQKWAVTMSAAFALLGVSFVSSAYAGGIQQTIDDFQCSHLMAVGGISLYVLGFSVGPLFWGPLSELWGRQSLFFGSFLVLTLFNIGAAVSPNIQTLLVMRFFAGAFGSSPLTNAGGVIADMFPASQRGLAMAIFAAAPFMGPVLGPIVGGFLGEAKGWRAIQGLLAGFTGFNLLVMAVVVPETYAPLLLEKRAARLSKVTGKCYVSKLEAEEGKRVDLKQAYKTALSRPWVLLLFEPIVLLLSIYLALIYGTLYMCFAAYPIVYQQLRGWGQGVGGLPFLGIAVGMIAAVALCIPENSRYNRVAQERYGGNAPPEQRLPTALIGCVAIPIGLFWFAWTNTPEYHYMISISAGAPFGFGMVLTFLSASNYLMDAYTVYAASVFAGSTVLRSLFGAVFPLFTPIMYRNLGVNWASSIPAFLALACLPAPFLFYKYGEQIRLNCKYARKAAELAKKLEEMEGVGSSGSSSADWSDGTVVADTNERRGALGK